MWDPTVFQEGFRAATEHEPFPYQERAAMALFEGMHLIIRAPTGSGKTAAASVPFFLYRQHRGWSRLVYALPLRTLVHGVYAELRQTAGRLGWDPSVVTMQTGEEPGDPYFERGCVIVTTYDQVLSGLLCGPYGLSARLHNINAASMVGTVLVFDEFHLMEPDKAFLTALAGTRLFDGLAQTVWMTATSTTQATELIRSALPAAVEIELGLEEMEALPAVGKVRRMLAVSDGPMQVDAVLAEIQGPTMVICNTVGRAQAFYAALTAAEPSVPTLLLHARFFERDRRRKEAVLDTWFGRRAEAPVVLVATQVVEAGLNLSCRELHTEVCPMNALAQRAGRCARFPGQEGTVRVYPLAQGTRTEPYPAATVERTWAVLQGAHGARMTPPVLREWVQAVHGDDDARVMGAGWRPRLQECLSVIHQNAVIRRPVRVSDFIRSDSDQVLVLIAREPPAHPGDLEGVPQSRGMLRAALRSIAEEDRGWYWEGDRDDPWQRLGNLQALGVTYVVCLDPAVAAYDPETGLVLGRSGRELSPPRQRPRRPGYRPLRAESLEVHGRAVAAAATARWEREHGSGPLLSSGWSRRVGLNGVAVGKALEVAALLHDLGKMQRGWQHWAGRIQELVGAGGRPRSVILAHTDHDPDDPDAQARMKLAGRRPPHAAAGAYYACLYLATALGLVPEDVRPQVASAVAAAITAHHGGWLPEAAGLEVDAPAEGAELTVAALLGGSGSSGGLAAWAAKTDRTEVMRRLLDLTAGPDSLAQWWPVVAYLTRNLRLADQGATREGSEG